MQFIALNGFRHSLRRYFTDRVRIVDRFNWTARNAAEFAGTIDRPTTVIGFSDGATAALTIANHSRWVRSVFAHSPMNRAEPIDTLASIFLIRTRGDTTPTYQATWDAYERYLANDGPRHLWLTFLHTLDPLPALPVRDAATWVMRRRKHQFHNGLMIIEKYCLSPIVADPFVTWQR